MDALAAPKLAARIGRASLAFADLQLGAAEAQTGQTPKDVVWTHRKSTLYRFRSDRRRHAVPILLVFALINKSYVFDLRPGNSFVEHLLEEGYDVFLLDWGVPGDEDADTGLDYYVCDAIPAALRETRRASGAGEATLLGWCIGGTLCAMYAALNPDGPVRNLVLLTTPVDVSDNALYQRWVARESFDLDLMTAAYPSVPGAVIDVGNKLLKPVTNYWGVHRSLFFGLLEGTTDPVAFRAMSKWVADSPPFPGRAYREWITWMYKENRLPHGRLKLRGRKVDLTRVRQSLLVVTASADHISPEAQTSAMLRLAGSTDAEHLDIKGGHVGLMVGGRARHQTWPQIEAWLATRSD